MPEVFTYTFMQRAFLVGNMIALIAPLIGVFLIMKGLSQIGHTISHVALAGVALGILTGIYPVYPAILISVLAALVIEKIRRRSVIMQNYLFRLSWLQGWELPLS